MTTARDKLRLMAPTYGFTPEEWQYRLADLTTAATVCGLFRSVRFVPGLLSETLFVEDDIHRESIKKRYMREVAMARGTAVTLHEPKVERDRDVWPHKQPAMPIQPLAKPEPVKVDKRTTEQGKQRMRTAAKARWARQKLTPEARLSLRSAQARHIKSLKDKHP